MRYTRFPLPTGGVTHRKLRTVNLPFVAIASISSLVFVVLALVARVPTYRFAPLLLVPLVWGLYLARRLLHLRPTQFALLAGVMVLHDLGALGFYQRGVMGISFDVYVHGLFGFAAGLVIYRYVQIELPLRVCGLYIATVLCVMGLGALHEIVEYASYLLLGEQKGMLKPAASYFFDTQRDLTSNFARCVAALVVVWLTKRARIPALRRGSVPVRTHR